MSTYPGPSIGYVGGTTVGNHLVAFMDEQEAIRYLEEDPAVRRVWAVTLSDGIEVEARRAPATLVARTLDTRWPGQITRAAGL